MCSIGTRITFYLLLYLGFNLLECLQTRNTHSSNIRLFEGLFVSRLFFFLCLMERDALTDLSKSKDKLNICGKKMILTVLIFFLEKPFYHSIKRMKCLDTDCNELYFEFYNEIDSLFFICFFFYLLLGKWMDLFSLPQLSNVNITVCICMMYFTYKLIKWEHKLWSSKFCI